MSNLEMIPTAAADTRSGRTETTTGAVTGMPRGILRLEGGAVLAAAAALYTQQGWSWWLFGILFLAPDIFMLGYVAGPRTGAAIYNIGHTYLAPGALAAIGMFIASGPVLAIAAIWVAHIGFDRLLGYGLKYPGGFHDTHLAMTGRG